MSETLIGITIGGKYRISKRLGQGGMAEVYLAHQENLERDVAIKIMHGFLSSDPDFLHRFKREARAMAAMNHPNIVAVYDFDVYGESTYYLVMEYISGGTLKDKLADLAQRGERLPLKQAVEIAREVADALDYAHGRNMIHRDVKPANIMLNERGHAILTDFGIVKLVGGQSMAYTATGALIGTPAYMSPEQALGKPGDARSDIYSLGVLLFQMVTGKLPFDADTPLAIVMKHVNEPVPVPVNFNPDVPADVQLVILAALAKRPEDRFTTAGEMGEALRRADLAVKATADSVTLMDMSESRPGTEVLPPAVARPASPPTGWETKPIPPDAPTGPRLDIRLETAPTPPKPVAPPERKRPIWAYALGGLVLLAVVVLAVMGAIFDNKGEVTPTVAGLAVVTAVSTPLTPLPATETVVPSQTPDIIGTAVAIIALTEDAQHTATPSPTLSPTPTLTPTPSPTLDATLATLPTCTYGIELVVAYTYQNVRFSSAPISTSFPANWTLKNSGSCPWAADYVWAYVSGETFAYTGNPLPLGQEVLGGAEITLTATFTAPAVARNYQSTWQLQDATGNPIGGAIEFTFGAYLPATPTPTATNTATPPAISPTPTGAVAELNYIYEVISCEYLDTEWRCMVYITPYGGGGGPYTVLVLDQAGGQATEFRGTPPFIYFAQARRCAAYNQEVRVIDNASGGNMYRHLYIDPDDYIAGGCTLP